MCIVGCRPSTKLRKELLEILWIGYLESESLHFFRPTAYSHLELLIAPHVIVSFSSASTASGSKSPSFTSATVLAKA